MEGKACRWYIQKEHHLNADDYNVCMQPSDSRLPSVCIGCFRGIDELKNFADLLRSTIQTGQVAEEILDAYNQIVAAIEEEAKGHG